MWRTLTIVSSCGTTCSRSTLTRVSNIFCARWRDPYRESASVHLTNASSPSKNTSWMVTSRFSLWTHQTSHTLDWLVVPWLLANIAQYSASSLLQRHEISSRASLQTTIIGSPVTAVHIWNSLHDNEVSVTSLQTFQHNLETFLFQWLFCTSTFVLTVIFLLIRPL